MMQPFVIHAFSPVLPIPQSFPGWCIRCMTWMATTDGFCPACGATTLEDVPPSYREDEQP